MQFLSVMTVLLLFQLTGELMVISWRLPLPGPVLGMLMMLAALMFRHKFAHQMRHATEQLLSHLSLLFIPAGVGVMVHVARLEKEWLAIAVAVLISTLLGLLVTAWTMQWMMKLLDRKDAQ